MTDFQKGLIVGVVMVLLIRVALIIGGALS